LTPSSTTYRIASSITRWQQPSGRPSPEAMPAQATAAGQPAIPPSLRLRQETEADTAEHLAPEHAHAVRMAPRRPGRSARRNAPSSPPLPGNPSNRRHNCPFLPRRYPSGRRCRGQPRSSSAIAVAILRERCTRGTAAPEYAYSGDCVTSL
jgi:hypothetical protein